MSNLELRPSFKALRDDLVLLSATTLSIICRRESARTVDAIKNQLPLLNKVSLALGGWTSTYKLAITAVLLTIWSEIGHCVKFSSLSMRIIACSVPVSEANQG